MIIIYTNFATIEKAKDVSKQIIDSRLAAAVDCIPMTSVYFNGSETKEAEKVTAFIKTEESKLPEIEAIIQKNSPNKIKCIAAIDVKRINREFKEWLGKCIQ